jgi:hypothetical protein
MNKFFTNLALLDTLEWFQCKRWMYHLFKLVAGAGVAFELGNLNVPIRWIMILTPTLTIWIWHIKYFWSEPFWKEVKDTIFDTTVCVIPLTLMIPKMGHFIWQSWVTMVAGAIVLIGAYLLMVKAKWNSP